MDDALDEFLPTRVEPQFKHGFYVGAIITYKDGFQAFNVYTPLIWTTSATTEQDIRDQLQTDDPLKMVGNYPTREEYEAGLYPGQRKQ